LVGIAAAGDAGIRWAEVTERPPPGDGAFHRLPVGGLVHAWVGCDDIETWISQKLAGGRDVGSDPGPMRVDVVGDAPGVVGRPDEREVGQWSRG
jgi:hypothetical protein